MIDLTWTMNCVLFGAKIIKLIQEGRKQEALAEIKNLSSEFDDVSANYLIMRLTQVS